MANYTVLDGDCFSSIAKAHGFYKYTTLYQHADNNATRLLRPNPNMLVPGDIVSIHDKRPRKVTLTLDGTTNLLIERCLTHLRLYVGCLDKTAYTLTSAQLTVGSKSSATLPDATGKLEMLDIDPGLKSASLVVQIAALPPVVPPVVPPLPPTPPDHPPTIVAADFTDPAPVLDGDAVQVTWTLKLGSLEPHTTVRGIQQRLLNLGYTLKPTGVEDAATQLAVKHYQAFGGAAAPSGLVTDVRAGLETLHDHP